MRHIGGWVVFALSLPGCLGHTLAGMGSDQVSVDHYEIAPQEKDAQLRCGGAPCASVAVDQPYRAGRSRGVFWGTVLVEFGIGAVAATQLTADSPEIWAPVCGAAFLMALMDLSTYVGSGGYGRQYDAYRLSKPVLADWRGQPVPLRLNDVMPPDAEKPPPTFSVAAAAAKRGVTASAAPAKAPPNAKLTGGKVAVLDLKSSTKELNTDDVRYFGDLVRAATLKAAPQCQVMTRENLIVLLQASGKDLSACEGECEVDTGRRIGADAIVSGEVLKVGTRYKLTLRLHETANGKLLGASVASGKSVDELDDAVGKAAAELFGGAP